MDTEVADTVFLFLFCKFILPCVRSIGSIMILSSASKLEYLKQNNTINTITINLTGGVIIVKY